MSGATGLLLRVRGASMLPALLPGDRVHVEPCALAELRAGEIAVVRLSGHWVAHRVLVHEQGLLRTQGDAVRRPDPLCAESDVMGRVTCIERHAREHRPRHAAHPIAQAGRWLLRRSSLARRAWLRWQRGASRA